MPLNSLSAGCVLERCKVFVRENVSDLRTAQHHCLTAFHTEKCTREKDMAGMTFPITSFWRRGGVLSLPKAGQDQGKGVSKACQQSASCPPCTLDPHTWGGCVKEGERGYRNQDQDGEGSTHA